MKTAQSLGEVLLVLRAESAQRYKAECGTLEGFSLWWRDREDEMLLEAKQRVDGGKPMAPALPKDAATADKVSFIEKHGLEAYQRAASVVAGKDTDMVFDLNDKGELIDEKGQAVTINGAPVRIRRNMPMEMEQFTAHALTLCGSRFKNAGLDVLPKLRECQKDGAFVVDGQRLDLAGAINAITEKFPHYVAQPADAAAAEIMENPWKRGAWFNITRQMHLEVTNPELAKRLKREAGVR